MCNPISWIDVDRRLLYLTGLELETKRGRQLIRHLGGQFWEDIPGHGATRYYFGTEADDGTITPMVGGADREHTAFDPEKIPAQIVADVKAGKFRGIFYGEKNLLNDTASKLYDETIAPARKLYDETIAPARKLYDETRATAWKLYDETIAPASKLYDETIAPASKLYDETIDTAWKLYEETSNNCFWDLFSDINNRAEEWK